MQNKNVVVFIPIQDFVTQKKVCLVTSETKEFLTPMSKKEQIVPQIINLIFLN